MNNEVYARSVAIIDSLSHPTLTGDWLGRGYKSSFDDVAQQAKQENFINVCAIGMANIEQYDHKAYKQQCDLHSNFIPIAGLDPTHGKDLHSEISELAQLGYKGIKIHPRFFSSPLNLDKLPKVFQLACELNLVVFYCTYMHCALANSSPSDPLYKLIAALKKAPNTKVILVHGGDVNLMAYSELARFNSNLLIDLSLTLMKYKGSSLDLDIQFLFNQFDRKICIGTDFPEYSYKEIRERFVYFAKNLTTEKIDNIAFKNLKTFLSL